MDLQQTIDEFARAQPIVFQAGGLVALFVLGWIADWIATRWMLRIARAAVGRSVTHWDDALLNAKFFHRVANLFPVLFVYFGAELVALDPTVELVVQRVALASATLITAVAISAFLNAVGDIYAALPDVGRRPIKGYLGFVRLLVYLICAIVALSILMDRSPWIFLSGLGAVSAVLLIVFRDTLLSLVASIQITSNHLLDVGDWIEMPACGADGDVIDVTLHTVKVQNWDKTITTIPTHAFIASSFKNWRGMSESNSRRIKRALYLDLESVRFLDDEEIERFSRFALLRDYIAAKQGEISSYNAEAGRNPEFNADIRRLTNAGTFRAYMLEYLKQHPKIHSERTLIVRQLPSGPEGLPIEIYCFTNDIVWANHEGIQSDLFDHFIAVAPEFGLRIFQNPSGGDFARLGEQLKSESAPEN